MVKTSFYFNVLSCRDYLSLTGKMQPLLLSQGLEKEPPLQLLAELGTFSPWSNPCLGPGSGKAPLQGRLKAMEQPGTNDTQNQALTVHISSLSAKAELFPINPFPKFSSG